MLTNLIHKILLGLGTIIGIGILSMLIIFSGLTNIKQGLQTLNETEETGSAAASYEREINAHGTSIGVLMYLHSGDAGYLDRVAKDEVDFERFLVQNQQVAGDAQERALNQEMARIYQEYRNLGETLIDNKDQLDGLSVAVAANFESAHTTIDELFQTKKAERQQQDTRRLRTLMAMNTEISKVSQWLDNYVWTLNPKYRTRIYANSDKFWEQAAIFQRLAINSEDEHRSIEIKTRFQKGIVLIENIFAQTDKLQKNMQKFLKLRAEMDKVFNERMRARDRVDVKVAKQTADWATLALMQTVGIIILTFILLGLGAAMLIVRILKEPLQELNNGIRAVSRGELNHRVCVKGRDEFAQIAVSFNLIAAKLKAITASKKRFKKSQQKLHRTNVHLQQELVQCKQTVKALQAFSRQLLNAQEQERRRIANELHDEIGQALSEIKENLVAVEFKQKPTRWTQRIQDTINVADSTLQQVRNLSLDLRPSLLDDLDLGAALRWHLGQQAQRTGFDGQFVAETLHDDIEPDIKVTCFRIAQEALTNIVLHAQAQRVMVELRQLNHELKLSIRDDGVGFDVGKAWKRAVHGTSLGVLGMQERAQLAGGRLEINSTLGRGTEIRASLPLS